MTQPRGLLDLPVEIREITLEELLVPRSRVNAGHLVVDIDIKSTIHSKLYHNVVLRPSFYAEDAEDDGDDKSPVNRRIYPQIMRTCRQIALPGARILYGKNQFEMHGSGTGELEQLVENNVPRRFLDMIGVENASMIKDLIMRSDVSASFEMSPRRLFAELIRPRARNDTLQLLFGEHLSLCSIKSIILTIPSIFEDSTGCVAYLRHVKFTPGITTKDHEDYNPDLSYGMEDECALKWAVLRAKVVLQQYCPSLQYQYEVSIEKPNEGIEYRYLLFSQKPVFDIKSDENAKFGTAITTVNAPYLMLERQ
jgi:hypothetical protein